MICNHPFNFVLSSKDIYLFSFFLMKYSVAPPPRLYFNNTLISLSLC